MQQMTEETSAFTIHGVSVPTPSHMGCCPARLAQVGTMHNRFTQGGDNKPDQQGGHCRLRMLFALLLCIVVIPCIYSRR